MRDSVCEVISNLETEFCSLNSQLRLQFFAAGVDI